LAPTVDLTAYRVVQESLTNALRYAGRTTARVTLSYTEDELRVEVIDGGRGRIDGTPQAAGHGIAGMRERAEAVGGTLIAGPVPEGGFRVQARLPLSAP
jgi:signal transduction histidine kinase